jgi:hypothetical protein
MVIAGAEYLLPGDSQVRCTYVYVLIRNRSDVDLSFDGSVSTFDLDEVEFVADVLTAPLA